MFRSFWTSIHFKSCLFHLNLQFPNLVALALRTCLLNSMLIPPHRGAGFKPTWHLPFSEGEAAKGRQEKQENMKNQKSRNSLKSMKSKNFKDINETLGKRKNGKLGKARKARKAGKWWNTWKTWKSWNAWNHDIRGKDENQTNHEILEIMKKHVVLN